MWSGQSSNGHSMVAARSEEVGPTLKACKTLKTGKLLESMNTQNYWKDKKQLLNYN